MTEEEIRKQIESMSQEEVQREIKELENLLNREMERAEEVARIGRPMWAHEIRKAAQARVSMMIERLKFYSVKGSDGSRYAAMQTVLAEMEANAK